MVKGWRRKERLNAGRERIKQDKRKRGREREKVKERRDMEKVG